MKLRIKNFRSIKDTGFIDIKPLTLLIGRNSSGKSTFLRTFPLLKQSAEEMTKSPILLYGRYVDFGTYKDIRPNFSSAEDNYELTITVKLSDCINHQILPTWKRRAVKYQDSDIAYTIEMKEDRKNSVCLSLIKIKYIENTIIITLNNGNKRIESLTVNDREIFGTSDELHFSESGNFIVDAYIEKVRKQKDGDDTIERVLHSEIDVAIEQMAVKLVQGYVHGNTDRSTSLKVLTGIGIGTDSFILRQLKDVKDPLSWHKNINSWTTKTPVFEKLRDYIIAHSVFNYMLDAINIHLQMTFKESKYIAPIRATAERYYRIQHLAVNEVEPNGQNLPAFLDSLTEQQISKFAHWTLNNFGFKVKIHKTEGHYSIKVIHCDDFEANLSDMGFGYSQILPVLTQLWYSSSPFSRSTYSMRRRRFSVPRIIAIEQPELHLHPEFQAKLADSLVKVVAYAKENGIDLRLVIETHSDTIINRVGDCVIDKEIDADDINIILFENLKEGQPTNVTTSGYDPEGNLKDWPLGFFQPTRK